MSASTANLTMRSDGVVRMERPATAPKVPNQRLGGLLNRARYVPEAGGPAPAGAPMARPSSAPSLGLLVMQAKAAAAMPAPDEDALWIAARRGDDAGARRLLSRGGARFLEWRCARYGGATPLHVAVRHNHHQMVDALLGAGADLEAKTDAGMTPLGIAASMGHVYLTKELLLQGAVRGARTKWGCSPLWLAACYGHAPVVQVLIERRADLEAKDNHRVTPLREQIACRA